MRFDSSTTAHAREHTRTFLVMLSSNCIEEEIRRVLVGYREMKKFKSRTLAMAEAYGVERMVFLSLSFPDAVMDVREAHKRWTSFRSNLVNEKFCAWMRVTERSKTGRLHLHVLGCTEEKIRGEHLRDERAFWRATATGFGFGRTHIRPVRSVYAVERYMKKYILHRALKDRWERLAACSHSLTRLMARRNFRPMPARISFRGPQ